MKTLAAALAVLLCAAPAMAGDITLITPITSPAITKVSIDAWKIDDVSVTVWYAFRAADNRTLQYGSVVLRDECSNPEVTNRAECESGGGTWSTDYSSVVGLKVDAAGADNGRFVAALLEKRIRNRAKQKLGIVGTEAP